MSLPLSESVFGGNRVVAIGGAQPTVLLANGAYAYRMVRLAAGQALAVDDLRSYSIFCLTAGDGGVAVNGAALNQGDVANVEAAPVTVTAVSPSVLLVAGVTGDSGRAPGMAITRSADHYRVTKPWGHELWFNGEHPGYVLKEVFIRGGNRTSLQYHHFKEETNLLVAGTATLVYKAAAGIANDDARDSHLGSTSVQAPSFLHIVPEVLHRLIAATDVLLYEASTPHLDDVIRVQDDSGRRDGRVAHEHAR
jgi:Mannose-6-phosphate isomerase